MKFPLSKAIMLILIGIAQLIFAREEGWFGWILAWSGLSWLLVGGSYLVNKANLFGKRPDGLMAWWSIILLFPYLVAAWLIWTVQIRMTKETCHNEIIPGLWLGRRCSAAELPIGIQRIVDLTSECPEPKAVTSGRIYTCVPTLDGSVPSLEAFQNLIDGIATSHESMYIHCALGRGRSAAVVLAILVVRGDAATLEQAEAIVKSIRPSIKINPPQRHLLEQWVSLPRQVQWK